MASRTMCTCHGTIHPLIPARTGALMCLNCGNIVCQAQGLGPCLFCGASCSNEQFAVTEELVTQQSASSASPAARQMNENLKRLVRRNPCEPLTEAEEKTAELFRQTILKNIEDAAEIDPVLAIKDDQDGLLGLLGD
ncbi:putative zinc finger motif, C2HC5-type domain-containing protein [Giardia duodenalis]|uniref:Zinc finger motif, C2HC5-type domain-containing protein n=2 Tax=Giardia intestinalis TaxID=5741 RepID=A8B4G3_GIAIC|nr:putative zinc finger motif, C2HC5-type domain-containing protein [Giardia intestinalis]KAE8303681.1 putative zinc finger motif, C2HC5-type domain-containing protein [Giardia intestinalis]|eukprot:XP_001709588.1 Hypothetical protein GL50803_27694 [Giardia lamblia ATCC 50803]